jgi:hypothetical protein
MKIYLELFEILPADTTEEADFFRIEITDWNEDDINQAISLLKSHAESSYSSFILQIHYCNHDLEPSQPCLNEILEMK